MSKFLSLLVWGLEDWEALICIYSDSSAASSLIIIASLTVGLANRRVLHRLRLCDLLLVQVLSFSSNLPTGFLRQLIHKLVVWSRSALFDFCFHLNIVLESAEVLRRLSWLSGFLLFLFNN